MPYFRRNQRVDAPSGSAEGAEAAEVAVAAISAKSRNDQLYCDHEMRQRRWLSQFAEKSRQHEEALESQRRCSQSARSFDKSAFDKWYECKMKQQCASEQSRQDLYDAQMRVRFDSEMAACSFAPKVESDEQRSARCQRRRKSPSSQRTPVFRSASAGSASSTLAEASLASSRENSPSRTSTCSASLLSIGPEELLDELAAVQARYLEQLHELDAQELDVAASAQREPA